jgi:TonB family protein
VFEDCQGLRKTNRRSPLQTYLALGISLVLHGLLVYGFLHARITIKILTIGTKVQNVRIVPPIRISLPKIVGAAAEAPPGGPTEEIRGATAPPGKAGRGVSPSPGPPPSARPAESGAVEGPTIASLSSKFQESMASRFKTDQGSELRIGLGPPGSKTSAGPPAAKGRVADFFQYIPGVTVTGRGRFGTGGGKGKSGTGAGQTASINIPLKGYNLAPWAQKVLELIIKNWDIPWVSGLSGKTQVKVIIVVRKSGDVSSVELVEGTARDSLDQAALQAVRASAPFPALPGDFPGDFLEASVEFTYHD